MKIQKMKKAFTLVELLIVIAIIGILSSLIFPAIANAFKQVDKVKAQNNASGISKSWLAYSKMDARPRMLSAKDIYNWAKVLAEKQDLNKPDFWLLDFDPAVMEKTAGGSLPITIVNKTGNTYQLNPEFTQYPISWEVANSTLPNAPISTPLIWTRGLKGDGYWNSSDSPFAETKGGVIGFVDGHVVWFESLHDEASGQGMLTVYGGTQRTANIAQAIKGGSENILRSQVK